MSLRGDPRDLEITLLGHFPKLVPLYNASSTFWFLGPFFTPPARRKAKKKTGTSFHSLWALEDCNPVLKPEPEGFSGAHFQFQDTLSPDWATPKLTIRWTQHGFRGSLTSGLSFQSICYCLPYRVLKLGPCILPGFTAAFSGRDRMEYAYSTLPGTWGWVLNHLVNLINTLQVDRWAILLNFLSCGVSENSVFSFLVFKIVYLNLSFH